MVKADEPRNKRGNYNLHPLATRAIANVADALPAYTPGQHASLLVMVGAAVVEARPDLVRAAADACLRVRDHDPARIGAVVGEAVVAALAGGAS